MFCSFSIPALYASERTPIDSYASRYHHSLFSVLRSAFGCSSWARTCFPVKEHQLHFIFHFPALDIRPRNNSMACRFLRTGLHVSVGAAIGRVLRTRSEDEGFE